MMRIVGIALFLSFLALAGGAGLTEALAGFAVIVLVPFVALLLVVVVVIEPGVASVLALGVVTLISLIGGLGMLDRWFDQREAKRRTARVAAGGDYLTARE